MTNNTTNPLQVRDPLALTLGLDRLTRLVTDMEKIAAPTKALQEFAAPLTALMDATVATKGLQIELNRIPSVTYGIEPAVRFTPPHGVERAVADIARAQVATPVAEAQIVTTIGNAMQVLVQTAEIQADRTEEAVRISSEALELARSDSHWDRALALSVAALTAVLVVLGVLALLHA